MPLSRIKSRMEVSQLRLDSSAASTDENERVLLDGTDSSDTNDGYALILEDSTANALDGGVATFGEMPLIGNVPIARVTPIVNQTISNNTTTIVTFAAALFDQGNYFDFTNNRYVPKVAGYYDVHCNIHEYSGTDVQSIIVYIRKNGSATAYSRITLSDLTNEDLYATSESVHDIVYLNGVDDYVDFAAYITSEDAGSPIILAYLGHGGSRETFATLKLIQRGPS